MENRVYEKYASYKLIKAIESLRQRHTHCLIFLMK